MDSGSQSVCFKNGVITYKSSENDFTPSFASTFKPRGALARALLEKQQADEYLQSIDQQEWYQCDLTQLPNSISSKFVQLSPDQESTEFLRRSEEKSDWILTQIWHTIAKAFLGWFITQTSINGWLQRGSMFVISTMQFRMLAKLDDDWHQEALLDLGAGDGEVTAYLEPHFDKVFVTEMSPSMRNLLFKKGYNILEIEEWSRHRKYDVISCLNLIDRCDTPLKILQEIKDALKPGGFLLLALVLPFSSYVEHGSSNHKPKELLPVMGSTFEEQVESLVKEVIIASGFEVESWSRIPYLCEGDLRQSYYWLDDVIFVLKAS